MRLSELPLTRLSVAQAQRLAVAGAGWGSLVLGTGQLLLWIRTFLANPLDQDFTIWYAAARIGLTQGWSHLYDLDRQQQMLRQIQHVQVLSPLSVYISPPPLAWLAAPLTVLPPVIAYFVWSGASVAALVAAWRLAAPDPGQRRWLYALPLVAWLPVVSGLFLGQPVALLMFVLALAVWLARRRATVAGGLVLSLALLKPQLVLLVGPAVLVGGELGFGLGWIAGSALLVGLSVAVVGVPGLERGLAIIRSVQVYPFNSYLTLDYLVDPVVRSGYLTATARVAVLNPVTLGLQGVVALATLAVAYRHRHRGPAVLVSIGLIGSILVAPHLHHEDFAILIVAAWLLEGDGPSRVQRLWPLAVLAAGEAPQVTGPLPLLASLLIWLFLLWNPAAPDRLDAGGRTPAGVASG